MQSKGSTIFSYNEENKLSVQLSGTATSSADAAQQYQWSMRAVNGEDVPFYQGLFANPTVMSMFADGQVRSAADTRKRAEDVWIKRFKDGQPHGGMTVLNNKGQLIGNLVAGLGDEPGVSEIAYTYIPEVWGKGVGKSTVRAIVEEWAPEVRRIGLGLAQETFATPEAIRCFQCFGKQALSRLDATASPANKASWRILAANGFTAAQYKLSSTAAQIDFSSRDFADAQEMENEALKNFDPLHTPQPLAPGVRIRMVDPDGVLQTVSKHTKYDRLKYHFERSVTCSEELGIGHSR
jgi:RimJ/RimL family protein N-acetyltransferase